MKPSRVAIQESNRWIIFITAGFVLDLHGFPRIIERKKEKYKKKIQLVQNMSEPNRCIVPHTIENFGNDVTR